MNWLTTLAFAVLLLSVQYDAAESKLSSVSRSPWANPAQANSLMNCLTAKIAGSNVLPQQEKEDLESIMDTMMSAIKGASAKGKSSAAQLQAINMAVASSLAELVVAEDAGNPASIAVKTDALSGAMGQCFQAVTGMVDQKFLGEINHLINMFAKEAATETNEIQDQEASYAAGSSGLSSFQDRSQTGLSFSEGSDAYSTSGFSSSAGSQSSGMSSGARSQSTEFGSSSGIQSSAMSSGARSQSSQFGSSAGSQSSAISSGARSQSLGFSSSADGSQMSAYNSLARSQTAGYGSILGSPSTFVAMSGTQSGLISRVANALANTETMRNVLRNSVAQGNLNGVVQGTIQSLARSLGLEENNLSRLAQQAIAQVPFGSDTSAYTQALSTALVNGGVLNESNIDILGSRVFSSVLNGMSSAAQSYGMEVDTSSVQNDISSSSSFLSSGASSASSSEASDAYSSSGFSSSAGSQSSAMSSSAGSQSSEFGSSSGSQSAMSSGASSQSSQFGSSAGSQSAAMSSGARSQSSDFGSSATSQSSGFSSSAASDRQASQFSSGRSQADYSQAGRYSSLGRSQANFNQAGDLVSSVASPLAGVSLRSTLSLPNGLRSGSAAARISQLTSSLGNAITPNGVDANALAHSLQSSFSNLQRSGMSASDAKIESLMERVVGLLQLLSNTDVRGVNMANAASVADSVTKSFELALV